MACNGRVIDTSECVESDCLRCGWNTFEHNDRVQRIKRFGLSKQDNGTFGLVIEPKLTAPVVTGTPAQVVNYLLTIGNKCVEIGIPPGKSAERVRKSIGTYLSYTNAMVRTSVKNGRLFITRMEDKTYEGK